MTRAVFLSAGLVSALIAGTALTANESAAEDQHGGSAAFAISQQVPIAQDDTSAWNGEYGLEACPEDVVARARGRGVFGCSQCPVESQIGMDVIQQDAFVVRFQVVDDSHRVDLDSVEVLEGAERPEKLKKMLSFTLIGLRFPPSSDGGSYSVTCGWQPIE